MQNSPFRLNFKRSQTLTSKPSFSLIVSAEMSPEFEEAAKKYGYINELVYADPKLEEARQLRQQKADEERAQEQRIQQVFDKHGAGQLASMFLGRNPIVWLFTLPFRIIWWIFSARRVQKHQIMRFSELKRGKTITTQNVVEILEAEKTIKQTAEAIESVILASVDYGNEARVSRSAA